MAVGETLRSYARGDGGPLHSDIRGNVDVLDCEIGCDSDKLPPAAAIRRNLDAFDLQIGGDRHDLNPELGGDGHDLHSAFQGNALVRAARIDLARAGQARGQQQRERHRGFEFHVDGIEKGGAACAASDT